MVWVVGSGWGITALLESQAVNQCLCVAASLYCLYCLQDVMDCIVDIREYDVPYHVRFSIDHDVRCGHWFTVKCKVGGWGAGIRGLGMLR